MLQVNGHSIIIILSIVDVLLIHYAIYVLVIPVIIPHRIGLAPIYESNVRIDFQRWRKKKIPLKS